MLELPYECAEPRPKLFGEVELRVLVVRLGEILNSRDHHAVPLRVDEYIGEQHLADRLNRVSGSLLQ